MKNTRSLLFLLTLIFGSATIHGARTPWVQECLDTIESYGPYLHYDHADCGSEDYPSDLKKLTENVTDTSISALSRWEFYILTKAVVKAERIIPSFLFGGPDGPQREVLALHDLMFTCRPVMSRILYFPTAARITLTSLISLIRQ